MVGFGSFSRFFRLVFLYDITFELMVVVVVLTYNQVRGHSTGSSHSGAEEYPRENTHTTQGGTRIYHS